jgi:23S rRNA pseudouridine2604 synthase
MSEPLNFPLRINRYLELTGQATRRGADELISKHLVRVNGKAAVLGQKIMATDQVVLLKKSRAKAYQYVLFYKPKGIVSHSPQVVGDKSIAEVSKFPQLAPMGRLDKASEGLILLTDDGRITERLLSPKSLHEKEYLVTVREPVPGFAVKILERGVRDQGEKLTAKEVVILDDHKLKIVLTEGKKHQIRRMLSAVRLTVTGLKRVRIMDFKLGTLRPGQGRPLTRPEQMAFLSTLGLPTT